jgi:hypothetical protein
MGLVETAGAKTKAAWNKPEIAGGGTIAPIRTYRCHLGNTASPIRAETLDSSALFAPVFRIGLNIAGESIFRGTVTNRGQIASDISILVIQRCIINVPWQKNEPHQHLLSL